MKSAALLIGFIAIFVAGCGSSAKRSAAKNSGNYYVVLSASAPFYGYGPQQATGPDKKLPRDTLLTVGRISFGYAKVKLDSGEEGYVAREDIRPAPPEVIAAVTATPTPPPAPPVNYPEPKLPPMETGPGMEPSAIPAPSPAGGN